MLILEIVLLLHKNLVIPFELITISTNANTRHINPICQFVINKIPNDVATPFPPLNPKNTGKVCPITTVIPAICTSNPLSALCTNFLFLLLLKLLLHLLICHIQ